MSDDSSCITRHGWFSFSLWQVWRFGLLLPPFGDFCQTFHTLIVFVTLRKNCFCDVHNNPRGERLSDTLPYSEVLINLPPEILVVIARAAYLKQHRVCLVCSL